MNGYLEENWELGALYLKLCMCYDTMRFVFSVLMIPFACTFPEFPNGEWRRAKCLKFVLMEGC
jgi:hypothetical protein